MIEDRIIKYLSDNLPVPVGADKPEPKPDRYVIVEKTGSGQADKIDSAVLAIKSHAETRYQAARLNDLVKDAMENAIQLDEISSCALNSDYDFTDISKKEYRYQAVFELVYL